MLQGALHKTESIKYGNLSLLHILLLLIFAHHCKNTLWLIVIQRYSAILAGTADHSYTLISVNICKPWAKRRRKGRRTLHKKKKKSLKIFFWIFGMTYYIIKQTDSVQQCFIAMDFYYDAVYLVTLTLLS